MQLRVVVPRMLQLHGVRYWGASFSLMPVQQNRGRNSQSSCVLGFPLTWTHFSKSLNTKPETTLSR